MAALSSLAPNSGRLRSLFDQAGARWLDLPILHPADPFLETAGEDIRRRMFVTEGRTGDRLALRPDFTIPVCLHHLAAGSAPQSYAYEGVVFRRHASGSVEQLETGFEDIGRPDRIGADAEAIALAVRGVAALGATNPVVQFGDIGLFVSVLLALGLPEVWRRRLRRSFGLAAQMADHLDRLSSPRRPARESLDPALAAAAAAHDREALVSLLEIRMAEQGYAPDTGRSAGEIADRYLDHQALSETELEQSALDTLREFLRLRIDLPGAAAAVRGFASYRGLDLGRALEDFGERAAAIAERIPPATAYFSAGFGRPLDYYTGLVFDVQADGTPHALAGGGRYDRLMEMLGAPGPVPAVGFTIRLDGQGGGMRR